jgi:hydroxymethylglutaryl-CoA lyase
MSGGVKIIECPRDAMQGWPVMISTEDKIQYISHLMKVGFDTLDCGSFVSPKAIPQMADTSVVIKALDTVDSDTSLLVIVANKRGAEEAVQFERIKYLGFPFSVSPTFQLRNANSSLQESLHRIDDIHDLALKNEKELVVYLSMAFGNPYGDEYDEAIVCQWAEELSTMGIRTISLADTVGVATPEQVFQITREVIRTLADVEIGVHLHSTVGNWKEKMQAAWLAGSRRYDGALKGIGGCPMAKDELVGNLNTEWIISFLKEKNELPALNIDALEASLQIASKIFH